MDILGNDDRNGVGNGDSDILLDDFDGGFEGVAGLTAGTGSRRQSIEFSQSPEDNIPST